MLRRFGFFAMMNIGILVMMSLIINIFGLNAYLTSTGINYPFLIGFSLVVGFSGSLISLFLSRSMAIRAYNIKLIDEQAGSQAEQWIYQTVKKFAEAKGLPCPQVGVYQSLEANAFATGASKNSSLVAVSTGLLNSMKKNEVEAVIAHEVGHIANGDMVTMALLQGVLNTFVVFLSRIIATIITSTRGGNSDDRQGGMNMFAFMMVSFVLEIIFGVLAQLIAMWFSRKREFRADAAAAELSGKENMIAALQRLKNFTGKIIDPRNSEMAAFKISNNRNLLALFSSHPPLDNRIKALQQS